MPVLQYWCSRVEFVWLSFGTSGSGRSRQVVTEYKWSQDRFHCTLIEIFVYIYIYLYHSYYGNSHEIKVIISLLNFLGI